jgi:hypothetical protein
MHIDHVIYGVRDLEVVTDRINADLGLSSVAGGRHDGQGTHNRIVPLGDGSFLELLAVADAEEASNSAIGALLMARIEQGDGLIGWAVAVPDLHPIVERLGTSISVVGRQGRTARLTGVQESLTKPFLPFFIERKIVRPMNGIRAAARAIRWIELVGDSELLSTWLGDATLPVRIVAGPPGVLAVGIGDQELRTH